MQGQKFLKDKKLYDGQATGVYTDSTRAAIRAYQKDNGLTVSGNFNQATLEKMNIALTDRQKGVTTEATTTESKSATAAKTGTTSTGTTATTTVTKKPAPFRANVDQIKAAQKILRDGKMLTGGEDGKLDDPTREGLGKYQDANTLKVTKTLNATTLDKMGIALTDAQKANVAAQAAYDAAAKKN
jgi:peptidoglycan hydrolase-like protein with peptidoglycan-binding domain